MERATKTTTTEPGANPFGFAPDGTPLPGPAGGVHQSVYVAPVTITIAPPTTPATPAAKKSDLTPPASVVAGIASVAYLIFAGVVLARARLSKPLEAPVVEVFGLTATAVTGLAVAGFGAYFLLTALAKSKVGIMFGAVIMFVASVVLAIEPGLADDQMGTPAVFPFITGCVAVGIITITSFIPTIRARIEPTS